MSEAELIGRGVLALLGYPGALLVLVLGSLLSVLALHQPAYVLRGTGALLRGAWWQDERLWQVLGVLAACAALVLLPFPLNPVRPTVVAWWWSWLAFEVAFLLPLLPALLTTHAPLAQAAIREVQIGVSGRAILWLALGVSLLLADFWAVQDGRGHSPLLGHAIALLAALLAFPAAAVWGSFATTSSVAPAGSLHGLTHPLAYAARAAHLLRVTALLLASMVSLLPMSQLAVPQALGMLVGAMLLGSVWLAWLHARAVQMPLPLALQRCWWQALPVAVAAVIYLGVLR